MRCCPKGSGPQAQINVFSPDAGELAIETAESIKQGPVDTHGCRQDVRGCPGKVSKSASGELSVQGPCPPGLACQSMRIGAPASVCSGPLGPWQTSSQRQQCRQHRKTAALVVPGSLDSTGRVGGCWDGDRPFGGGHRGFGLQLRRRRALAQCLCVAVSVRCGPVRPLSDAGGVTSASVGPSTTVTANSGFPLWFART